MEYNLARSQWKLVCLESHFFLKKNSYVFHEHIFQLFFYFIYIKSLQYIFLQKFQKFAIQTGTKHNGSWGQLYCYMTRKRPYHLHFLIKINYLSFFLLSKNAWILSQSDTDTPAKSRGKEVIANHHFYFYFQLFR